MSEKRRPAFYSVGTSSLLVVFTVLVLATFSALALSTARNDYSLSENFAVRTSQYYTACSEAEEIIAAIDNSLSKGIMPEETSFFVRINESNALYVELDIDCNTAPHYYKIVKWQKLNINEWNGESANTLIGAE